MVAYDNQCQWNYWMIKVNDIKIRRIAGPWIVQIVLDCQTLYINRFINWNLFITLGVTSLDGLLDEQPSILELTEHARTAQWNRLGVRLELDGVALAGCYDYVSMYQLWIMEKAENATRRNLITALRAIGQNNVAFKYENYLKSKVSDLLNVLCYFYAENT